jgi:LPS-assembly lipoprotein
MNKAYQWPVYWVMLLSLAITACGFQLRGMADLSFKHLHIQGKTLSISKDLARTFASNQIKIVDKINEAELLLELLDESNQKRIQSLSGGGLVREFELNYQVQYRTRQPADALWSKVQTVQVRRDFSYDDKNLLGKADEETRLNTDMRNDAIREIMRRLGAIKPALR